MEEGERENVGERGVSERAACACMGRGGRFFPNRHLNFAEDVRACLFHARIFFQRRAKAKQNPPATRSSSCLDVVLCFCFFVCVDGGDGGSHRPLAAAASPQHTERAAGQPAATTSTPPIRIRVRTHTPLHPSLAPSPPYSDTHPEKTAQSSSRPPPPPFFLPLSLSAAA